MKTCTKCGEEKSIKSFHVDKKYKDGYNGWCKECIRKNTANYQRMKSCGVDEFGYQVILENQEYSCAICGVHIDDCKRSLAVDHDHNTGLARGLLCGRCNIGLGYFQDSVDLLRDAEAYLLNFGE